MKGLGRILLVLIAVTLLFMVQILFTSRGSPLNLLILPVYVAGLRSGYQSGFWTGILIGFMEDALTGGILVPSILSKGVAGVAASSMFGRVFIWRPFTGAVAVAVLTVLDESIRFLMLAFFFSLPATPGELLLYSIISSLILMPAGYVVRPGNGK